MARYRALTSEAADAFGEGEFRKTITLLSEARGIHDHPDLTYNMGRAYEAMGWCGRARETFTIYSKRKDVKRADRQTAAKRLEALATCEEVREVQVKCSPAEAKLRVDGQPEIDCSILFELKAGTHTIEVIAPQHSPTVLSVNITEVAQPPEVDIAAHAPQQESMTPFVGWSLVGGGVLVFAAGLVLDATAAPDAVDPFEVESLNDDASTRRNLTMGLYIGGAALVVSGGGLLIWHYTTSGSDEVSLRATPSGASLRVRF